MYYNGKKVKGTINIIQLANIKKWLLCKFLPAEHQYINLK